MRCRKEAKRSTAANMSNDGFGTNDWIIEELREHYLADPSSVSPTWREYFANEPERHLTPRVRVPATVTSPETAQPLKGHPVSTTPLPGNTPVATVEPSEVRTESPSIPGAISPLGPDVPNPFAEPVVSRDEPIRTVLKGPAKATALNMDASLMMPTATSLRTVPMKLVIENRASMNNFLRRSWGGKVSFTHIIAYAMVQAIKDQMAMNTTYEVAEGKPSAVQHSNINLGIAIDVERGGKRQLLVPNIKSAEQYNFARFYAAYETLVRKARKGELTMDNFTGTTVSITNPGGIGTNASVPRLMPGQAMILGVGSIDYTAEFAGTSLHDADAMAVSKVTTLTSTYDHRVIQGAQSGEFLRRMHSLLLGADNFYEEIFQDLRIPYPPVKWAVDIPVNDSNQLDKSARVAGLISAFRTLGHLQADTDPLEFRMRTHPDLELEFHGLTLWDLDRTLPVGRFGAVDNARVSLRGVIDQLRNAYCHTMGIEYMHIHDIAQRRWIQDRLESPHRSRSREGHLRILDQLNEAEVFETFLQTKYVGQTRFSLEGAESAIVVLAAICEAAADAHLGEVAIGMPHRGRLNVLTSIVGKLYSQVFREFDNRASTDQVSGDVKYHLGADGHYTAASGNTVRTSVAANPSHLETVDPVLEGIARAKNDQATLDGSGSVLPVLMHGDASFAGQGVVYETFQMSQLRPYRNGGTIHIVVNNQIGFTTSPGDARSSVYATDVAKSVQAPVIHVNGDDPDACAEAAGLAFDFRETFGKDVVIDMLCYRRHGHNEGDDPSLTQPLMYHLVEKKRSVRKLYTEQLIGRGDISMADAEASVNRFRDRLEEVFSNVRDPLVPKEPVEYRRVPVYPAKAKLLPATSINEATMQRIAEVHQILPEGFTAHPKVITQLNRRAVQISTGPIDWATAELLAFGSLLMEGHRVRLVGQDARRGTFSQRFGAIVDQATNEAWVPLKHLTANQAPFDIFDSLLSEYAALGFEYGYSVAAPDALVCWEAQYGDFVNGAQIITDEFVSSGFTKWTQKSGVVLLLPHGYEGAGPDHSSARLERFLQLCTGDNMAVCQPSTPASYFHLLRRHVQINQHRPLIIATPKSMLRNKAAVSTPQDFTTGTWEPVLDDPSIADRSKVRRIVLCSGKVAWDLKTERARREMDSRVAIITLERLFPLPVEELVEVLAAYPQVDDIRWVQDEPANQGPAEFFIHRLMPLLGEDIHISFHTRPALAAPSTGLSTTHKAEHLKLMDNAFAGA
ncbi:oxoglutarate dehydrogenase (succinyl-transferring), E1 component [Propionibacterium sp. oral taxon 192 str. F0372]|uniref:multifunctional oxoglutarate decarboxylase/oxoglutarate dehydrogenase thiamine pyrophosphate-binding subunit/dihydrolipoyllysine-residue succinyltransferase subunit n=1 Tax=Propionibacterium sp. oral taxon 192 TaxID=671222 RepID=UPI00035460A6|nr:multifunctional oxoglutarate decarboxylase/oxoglutarate dehydrogenase thiamine pyrophosphate-binding subunit/dihydrolipoyllysine-residue succinyltransferase subunit [Propionibacterium sp. oral taxon 192]EPH02668.1 oxoglutarate dehydrogenase (succinyl-transferring), E1 component [Propionibacterium sp. oral taxon 192 str. F0372]